MLVFTQYMKTFSVIQGNFSFYFGSWAPLLTPGLSMMYSLNLPLMGPGEIEKHKIPGNFWGLFFTPVTGTIYPVHPCLMGPVCNTHGYSDRKSYYQYVPRYLQQ